MPPATDIAEEIRDSEFMTEVEELITGCYEHPLHSDGALPRTQRFEFDESEDGQMLEFRLIYSGRLPAEKSNNTRVADKHRIRKHFHKQLAELWKHNREL